VNAFKLWRASGLRDATIAVYIICIRRYREHCKARGLDEVDRLSLVDVTAYARAYVGKRRGRRFNPSSRLGVRQALHAWWCALSAFGAVKHSWTPIMQKRRRSVLLQAYAEYRQTHRGVAASTLERDLDLASRFLRALKSARKRFTGMRAADIDKFVEALSATLSRRTVAGLCSSLRCFVRFLHATGHLHHDVSSWIIAPRYRTDENLPRALPWNVVRRILRSIPRSSALGRRDFAIFLLMATYGLGAGEIVRLQLKDVDWHSAVLRARRPKTLVPLELPLLPSVARAVSAYLRHARPNHTQTSEVFVTMALPHRALTSSALLSPSTEIR